MILVILFSGLAGGLLGLFIFWSTEIHKQNFSLRARVAELEDEKTKALAALGHCVEVLDDLKPSGHAGDPETGEHEADCMLCRVEAALDHSEDWNFGAPQTLEEEKS